jgi:hypothetical protein
MPFVTPDAAASYPGREPKYSMCSPTARRIEGGPEGVDPRHGVDLSLRAHDAKGKAVAVGEIITKYLTNPGRLGTPQSDARLRNHARRRGRRHP